MFVHRCTLDPGDKILDCPPTFTMYAFDAAVNGASVIKGACFSDKDFLFQLLFVSVIAETDFLLNVELVIAIFTSSSRQVGAFFSKS